MNISAILCADWAKDQRKRAVFVADIGARTVSRIARADWSLAKVLDAAQPLGVPAIYLQAASRSPLWASPATFIEFLRCVWSDPGYLDMTVCARDWTVERPFFEAPAGEGGLTSYVRAAEAVGVDLYRAIDRQTKGEESGYPRRDLSAGCLCDRVAGRSTAPPATSSGRKNTGRSPRRCSPRAANN
jgi:hypothetical protein